ncbi:MAG: winged helix-turn-helix transcriptional regulator [Phycisphaerae bacterium]|nr:winged helix-turn-helix transcriptional regulator [Phycisphaerae bacterium]
MNKKDMAKYQARADIIKALAHPTRLFMVDQLGEGEKCVCELTDMIKADTSTVSKHLSVLKSAGLIRDDKRGTSVYYQLKVPCLKGFFGCIENVMRNNVKEQMELLK